MLQCESVESLVGRSSSPSSYVLLLLLAEISSASLFTAIAEELEPEEDYLTLEK